PSVKLLKKIHVGSKLRRPPPPPPPTQPHHPQPQNKKKKKKKKKNPPPRSLDPFQLAKTIDRKLERIYGLANRRLSPQAQEKLESNQAQSGRRKGCGKDARFASLKIPSGFPLPHSHNNKHSLVTYQMAGRGALGL